MPASAVRRSAWFPLAGATVFSALLFGPVTLSPHHDNHPKDYRQNGASDPDRGLVHLETPFNLLIGSDYIFSIMGIKSRTRRVITGPIVTTNNEGRTQKKIGNTSFTASF